MGFACPVRYVSYGDASAAKSPLLRQCWKCWRTYGEANITRADGTGFRTLGNCHRAHPETSHPRVQQRFLRTLRILAKRADRRANAEALSELCRLPGHR